MEPDALPSDTIRAGGLCAATREHVIAQVQRELDAEVSAQNRSATASSREFTMRELSNMATTMREAVAALKQKVAASTAAFQAEVGHSTVNVGKVDAMTSELKAANKEVEQMLGQSGSNFTPDGSNLGPADINGVQVNKDA